MLPAKTLNSKQLANIQASAGTQTSVVYPCESILDAKVMNHTEATLRARRGFSPLAFLLTQEENNLVITSSK